MKKIVESIQRHVASVMRCPFTCSAGPVPRWTALLTDGRCTLRRGHAGPHQMPLGGRIEQSR